MIVNAELLPIALIVNSKFEFYLTGSRYFGTEKEGSDYDFFVLDSVELRDFLENNGFRKVKETGYKDTNTVNVYIHDEYRIHIQIVVDVKKKLEIQKILTTAYNNGILNQKDLKSKHIWNLAYLLYYSFKLQERKENG